MHTRLGFAVLALAMEAVVAPHNVSAQMLYWLNHNGLYRASVDGSIQELVRARITDYPQDAVLDVASGIIYWRGTIIHSSHIDGQQPAVPIAYSGATGRLAFDRFTDRVYWDQTSFPSPSRVWSKNADGTDTQELAISGIGSVISMTIDSAGQNLYWAESQSTWLRRVSLAGGAAEDLADLACGRALKLRVDADGAYIYWINLIAGWIQRVSTDTGVIENLVQLGNTTPFALEVNNDQLKILWIDNNSVHQANLDGSAAETLSMTPLNLHPNSKVLIDPARGWVLEIDTTAKVMVRMDFDGLQRKTIVSRFFPNYFAIDTLHRKLYWSSMGSVAQISFDLFERAKLDGSFREQLGSSTGFGFSFVAQQFVLDPSRQRISWTARNAGDVITSWIVSTSDFNAVSFHPVMYPWPPAGVLFEGITLDPQHDVLYWTYTDYATDESGIRQLTTLGGPSQPLITGIAPVDLRFEPTSRKLYWTDSSGYIMRASTDGSSMEPVVTTIHPQKLAIDSRGERMFWTATGGLHTSDLDGSDSQLLIPGIDGILQFDDKIVCDSNGDARLDLQDFAAFARCFDPLTSEAPTSSCASIEVDVPDGRIDLYDARWLSASMTGP